MAGDRPGIAGFHQVLLRGDLDECRAYVDSMMQGGAQEREYLACRAEWLRRTGDMPGALQVCLAICERFPGWDGPRYTLADVASHLGWIGEGVAAIERIASGFVPEVADQIRAEAWYALGRDDAVIGLQPKAVSGGSSNCLARLQAAQSTMRSQGIAAGIGAYARAWTAPAAWQALGYLDAAGTADLWWGQCAPPKVLRLTRRGGIGDYVQWRRYVPILRALGVEVRDETGIETRMEPAPAPQDWTGLFDGLPAAPREAMWADPFALFTALFPRVGYFQSGAHLQAPSSAAADAIAASARRAAHGKPCVAIFWSANESHGNFALKSACLNHVATLLQAAGIHWVVMQRGHEMKLWMQSGGHGSTTNIEAPLSIDDTAAVLSKMDAAVVVDTAIAHIAGSLGIPTYLLLGAAPCWRYETFSDATPWYASMRLFRQPSAGDWDGAIRNLRAALPRG